MTATIFLVGASSEELAMVGALAPGARVVSIGGSSLPKEEGPPDLAILFGDKSVGRVNEMLAELAFDEIIPTLLVVDAQLADQVDEVDLPVTDLVRRPIQRRLLKTRIETQLSLSRALRDVEAISAIGQSAAVTDRRVFDILLEYEVRRKQRYGGTLSMAVLAVEEPAKDIALAANVLRDVDTIAPISADTAAALMPETEAKGAEIVGQRLHGMTSASACVVGTLQEGEGAIDFLGRLVEALGSASPGSLKVLDSGPDAETDKVDWSQLD